MLHAFSYFSNIHPMKKRLLSLLLLFAATAMYADDAKIVIKQKSGNETILELSTNPIITFEGEDMVITNDFTAIVLPLEDIDDYVVSDATTGIESITAQPEFHHGHIIFTDMVKGMSVFVYALDGRMVDKQTVGDSGRADVIFENLPKGTYIISTQNKNIKVINK